jgi:hypothetical protein
MKVPTEFREGRLAIKQQSQKGRGRSIKIAKLNANNDV